MGSQHSSTVLSEVDENSKSKHPVLESKMPKFDDNISLLQKDSNVIYQLIKHSELQEEQYKEWKLLYSIGLHGRSINTLDKQVSLKGPTFTFIRSKETLQNVTQNDYIFGFFCSNSWKVDSDFFGDRCFLFCIQQQIVNRKLVETGEEQPTNSTSSSSSIFIYEPSNYNRNYLYFNYGSKYTKYNGIVVGGKILEGGAFGAIQIDEDLTLGKTNSNTMTFPNCPILHLGYRNGEAIFDGDANFTVDELEIIGFPMTEKDAVELKYRNEMKEAKMLSETEKNVNRFMLEAAGISNGNK